MYLFTVRSVGEQLLFSTLRLEIINNNGQVESIGTGFIVRKRLNEDRNLLLLISNRHVLTGGVDLRITFHRRNGNNPDLGNTFTVIIEQYADAVFSHPNPAIDLACINISTIVSNYVNDIYYKYIDEDQFANLEEDELDVGQNIRFIGYPDNRYDRFHNLPIMRTGITASHPKINFDGDKKFIIDAQVFPGSSGSPVIIDLSRERVNSLTIGAQDIRLLGVVTQTMIRHNSLQPVNLPRLGTQEVLGLGIVYNINAVKELINGVAANFNRT
jgi:S1-C subfamily serine protease